MLALYSEIVQAYSLDVAVIQQLAVVIQHRDIIVYFLLVLRLLSLRVLRAQTQAAFGILHCDNLEARGLKSQLEVKHFNSTTRGQV